MDTDYFHDLFEPFGQITVKRMFGGAGIYHQDEIIAIVIDDGEVCLKADAESAPEFAAAGSTQWTYEGKNKPVKMPYWHLPDAALDDPDAITRWAKLAYEAALRSKKPKKKTKA